MEVFGLVEHPAGGICLAVPAGAVGHVELVDTVPAVVAHVVVFALAPPQSMADPETVYLAVCLVSLSSPIEQVLFPRHYAEVAGLV